MEVIKWVLSEPLLKFSWYPCKISTYSLSYIMSFLLLADLELTSVLVLVIVCFLWLKIKIFITLFI